MGMGNWKINLLKHGLFDQKEFNQRFFCHYSKTVPICHWNCRFILLLYHINCEMDHSDTNLSVNILRYSTSTTTGRRKRVAQMPNSIKSLNGEDLLNQLLLQHWCWWWWWQRNAVGDWSKNAEKLLFEIEWQTGFLLGLEERERLYNKISSSSIRYIGGNFQWGD